MTHRLDTFRASLRALALAALVALLVVPGAGAGAAPAINDATAVLGPVAERMIVIAGAALLISVWQRWRGRGKDRPE